MEPIINTFVLVYKEKVISPVMTTTREYGNWLSKVFDEYTVSQELYTKARTKDGKTVLESHPGTKIGKFFDKNTFTDPSLKSWFILQDSKPMERLVKYNLAELRDAIPISVNDNQGRRMLRVYTTQQIELYIHSCLSKDFNLHQYCSVPKQVKVTDISGIIKPEIQDKRKALF